MKKIKLASVLILVALFVSACGGADLKTTTQSDQASQDLFGDTLGISRDYIALHVRTEKALLSASSYAGFADWNREMDEIIAEWDGLANNAERLEKSAENYESGKVSFGFVRSAGAVSTKEINDIFDRAPAGQKIKTLAKHLGVDAKRAHLLLQQAQAQVEADAWNEAGDTFQALESTAVVIKDGAKVAGFVGGLVISGGTAGFAAAGVATKAAVVVGGADLVLEVTEDASKIALGNNNKVAEIVGSARVVTEPIATILAINSIPENLGSGFDKFNAVMAGLDQFRVAAQEGKVVGVTLPAYKGEDAKDNGKIEAVAIDEAEINEWLSQFGLKRVDGNIEEILEKTKQKITEAKQAGDRVEETKEEIVKEEELVSEISKEQAEAIESKNDSKIETVPNVAETKTVQGGSDKIQIDFVSPVEDIIKKGQARMWKVEVKKSEDMVGLIQMCQWTFYLNGAKFREMPDNRSCAFTSTFIDQLGSLRAEVKVELRKGRSVFDDQGNFKELVYDVVESATVSRDFSVEK